MSVKINSIYQSSDDIVAREIEGEIIIIPLVAGIGDMEDELFTLNETAKAFWQQLDGEKSLENIINNLEATFDASQDQIRKDVLGLVNELLKRRILVEVKEI